jgi:hypothetical protein
VSAVWGTSSKNIYLVSFQNGTITHYDGTSWSAFRTVDAAALRDVWGTGPDDVYFVGDQGKIFHFDGAAFGEMRTDFAHVLYAVWGSGSKLFATADNGQVQQRSRQCALSETLCSDGNDDDCDGLLDCADPDCAPTSFCSTGGLCSGAATLACNTTAGGSLAGGEAQLVANGCDPWLRNGREKTYKITPANSGTVSLTLSGLTNDVDLQVFASAPGGACDPYGPGCITASSNTGTSGEIATFAAQAGKTYYVVVDSYGTYSASFSLQATCP